jgi:hypothetical protein
VFLVPLLGATGGAGAASLHRAAVIVEGDGQTHRVVVEFPEDSISGIELLRRAGAEPVVYAYSGIGGAVCRLYGIGRDAGPECLGGTGGDARYWAYFRAPAGTSTFRYAAVGGGTSTVRDGDVEGWRYGTGAAPTYVSIDAILGVTPPPAAASTTTIPVGATTATAVPGQAAPPGSVAGASGPDGPVTPVAGASGVDGAPVGASGEPSGPTGGRSLVARPAAARPEGRRTGSGRGPESLLILAGGLGGLGGAAVWARRARRAAGAR